MIVVVTGEQDKGKEQWMDQPNEVQGWDKVSLSPPKNIHDALKGGRHMSIDDQHPAYLHPLVRTLL
jgi:hypothetical protein